MTQEKKFIGITKDHTFDNGGTIIKIGIPEAEVLAAIKNGWLNLVVSKRKEAKGDGKDYYTCIDTFEPKEKSDDNNIAEENVQGIPF